MPASLPFSFNKAIGARSIMAVSALHLSLALLALVSALISARDAVLISARDAVSSRAESDFLIRLGGSATRSGW